MPEILPESYFRFLERHEIDMFDFHSIPDDDSKGYILEVDLKVDVKYG